MKKLLVALMLCTCNQHVYDLIYKEIVQTSMKTSSNDKHEFLEKNNAVENLRALCKGQRSTYELEKPCKIQ